jgi:hypothetical protein
MTLHGKISNGINFTNLCAVSIWFKTTPTEMILEMSVHACTTWHRARVYILTNLHILHNIHTYINTYIHACTHTRIHTYVRTCIHTAPGWEQMFDDKGRAYYVNHQVSFSVCMYVGMHYVCIYVQVFIRPSLCIMWFKLVVATHLQVFRYLIGAHSKHAHVLMMVKQVRTCAIPLHLRPTAGTHWRVQTKSA